MGIHWTCSSSLIISRPLLRGIIVAAPLVSFALMVVVMAWVATWVVCWKRKRTALFMMGTCSIHDSNALKKRNKIRKTLEEMHLLKRRWIAQEQKKQNNNNNNSHHHHHHHQVQVTWLNQRTDWKNRKLNQNCLTFPLNRLYYFNKKTTNLDGPHTIVKLRRCCGSFTSEINAACMQTFSLF